VTLISAFEVPIDADESFLAALRGAPVPVVHRAWRPDAEFRFVVVASDATAAIPDTGFTAHASAYEVIHEDGVPDGTQGVALINPFEVPSDDDERFVAGWARVHGMLSQQRGYLGTRLHRAVAAADFRFVNIARWSSPLMFSRAIGRPDIRDATAAMPYTSHPALYQVIRSGGQDFS
jgi:hypothetical protein